MAPSNNHFRPSGGLSNVKRTQNVAAKAAAQRLAQVMASQSADEDEELEEEHNLGSRYNAPRPGSYSSNPSSHSANSHPIGQYFVEPSSKVHSAPSSRPSISVHPTTLAAPSRSTLKYPVAVPLIDLPGTRQREKRFLPEAEHFNINNSGNRQEAAAFQDELDMLQEENENFIYKLRLAEERCEEAEARTMELEKQVAALGNGVSLEAKLLSRKEAVLRQREVALKDAMQTKEGRNEEIMALQSKFESVKEDTVHTLEQIQEAKSEAKALRSLTKRMILTQEEMEEVVLKRCWLTRYWGLALQYGVCKDIALTKYEHWLSLAPLPFEVVISSGQKAKEEALKGCKNDPQEGSMLAQDLSDQTGEGYIESMLSVEMGLRELAYLKIEDAVMLALSQKRCRCLHQQPISGPKSPGDPKYMEAFELGQEESEDVLFKEAWLAYIWGRAKLHGLEEDIAEERLQYWTSRSSQSPTSHDTVNVERGMMELRELGIEQQLWDLSRKEFDQSWT